MSRIIQDPRHTDVGAEFVEARARRGRAKPGYRSPPPAHVVELRREAVDRALVRLRAELTR